MEEYRSESSRSVNPRRRKPTKAQIIKEKYLPLIILALILLTCNIALLCWWVWRLGGIA